jgi:predicted heme/steroid binding protein/uncharacterized membrane protein
MSCGRPVQTFIALLLCLLGMFIISPSSAFATPDFARQTDLKCLHCHVDAMGGSQLTLEGNSFRAEMNASGRIRALSFSQHIVRLIIGYLHMMAAIMWFGTILYVHLLLKPAYASKGLPKGELRLGWISMLVLLITGTLLTISRITSWDMFFTTRFGILLGIKICLYLIMLSSAVIVTSYIGPRLRKQKTLVPALDKNNACTLEGLSSFDGKDGRPAYVAYKGILYDVTGSRFWRSGSHMMKHAAGNDLTDILKTAPHGEDKILALPRVGTLLATSEKPEQPFHMKLFYVFAYMNLILVFVITFVIALWRWW